MTRSFGARAAAGPRRGIVSILVPVLAAVALAVLPVSGCAPREPEGPPVVVGGKTNTEQRILVEIVSQALEDAGMRAERRYDLGGSSECDEMIRSGKIDVYVEYAGTALWSVMRSPAVAQLAAQGPQAVLERAKTDYASRGVVWSAWLGFESPFVLVARSGQTAARIADIVSMAKNWRGGFDTDFQTRPDGLPALKKVYDLSFAEVRTIEPGKQYEALVDHQMDVAVGRSTDAAIAKLGLRVLDDEKNAFTPNPAAAVVRRAALTQFPNLLETLNALAMTIDTPTMLRMNEAVENAGRTPSEVAREFLDSL